MRIKSIRIKNFRSFRDETIEFEQYTCLVGANGAGKSTILCALNVFFRETQNATTDLISLHAEDFYCKDTKVPIEITVEFTDLSKEAQEDFSDYFRQGLLAVTAKAVYDENSLTAPVKQFGQRLAMMDFAPFFKALNDAAPASDLKTIYAELRKNFPDLPHAASKDAMTGALREYETARPAACELIPSEDQFYGISKGANRLARHVQWVYVPAVKDASEEQSEAKNSAIGRLLARAVRSKVNFSEELRKITVAAQEQYHKLLTDNQVALDGITKSLGTRLGQWAHPDAGLKVQWQQDPKKSVQVEEPLAGILAREGEFEGQIARFGHGLQRSFLLSLLQELAETEGVGPALILACEEPELYQHPPQARHLATVLRTISQKGGQVFLTTHSPYFVSGHAFENIRLVRRVQGTPRSTVNQYDYKAYAEVFARIKGKAPMKPKGAMAKVCQVLQPSLNEIFFAQRLVLVEGWEDVAYIHAWLSLTDRWQQFRERGLHVVPVQAKSALLQPLLISYGLKIPTFTVFDSDSDVVGTTHEEIHRQDNIALLKALGEDHTVPFPSEPVWGANRVSWSTNMGQTIESEINADAWKNARNFASAECGNAKDLTKNTLHIGYRLAWLWERGHHSASLERLVESILNFA